MIVPRRGFAAAGLCRSLFAAVVALLAAAPAAAYEDAALGFRVQDPPKWELRTETEKGAVLRYYAPPAPGIRASLGVSVAQSSGPLDRGHMAAIVRQLAAGLEGFRLLGSKAIEVAGLPGHRFGYRASSEERTLRVTQVLVARAGSLYAFTLTSAAEDHERYLPTFDRLVNGLEWLQPEGAEERP